MNRARDAEFEVRWVSGGIRFYPYQIGLGISISFWPCIQRPQISLHVGPLKIWLGISGQQIGMWLKRMLDTIKKPRLWGE